MKKTGILFTAMLMGLSTYSHAVVVNKTFTGSIERIYTSPFPTPTPASLNVGDAITIQLSYETEASQLPYYIGTSNLGGGESFRGTGPFSLSVVSGSWSYSWSSTDVDYSVMDAGRDGNYYEDNFDIFGWNTAAPQSLMGEEINVASFQLNSPGAGATLLDNEDSVPENLGYINNLSVNFANISTSNRNSPFRSPADTIVLGLEVDGIVQVASPVPVPAAAWLFGSALLGLVGIKRQR